LISNFLTDTPDQIRSALTFTVSPCSPRITRLAFHTYKNSIMQATLWMNSLMCVEEAYQDLGLDSIVQKEY